jgi:hypothetical protein
MNQSTMERTAPGRFWAKVDKRGPDDCWEWQAALTRGGYGTFVVTKNPKRMARAHRFALELVNGTAPDGLVCHKCDNPLCVNPSHLFIGTNTDNMRDCADKGRIKQQQKTHCKAGHEFTPENTYTGHSMNGRPRRTCRQCVLDMQKKRYDRLRAMGVMSKDI